MKKYLGIELGSTRIKAVLIDESFAPIVSAAYDWENEFKDGYWTYDLDRVWAGLKDVYAKLAEAYLHKCGQPLITLDGLGISAMMHGYLAFDRDGKLLVPFRTWRNTTTEQAAAALTEKFDFNIPQRWSIAHLYQAMLSGESHVKDVAFLTTLAGYVHYMLTGEKVVGVGEASGIFPVDSKENNYNARMVADFDSMAAEKGFSLKLAGILPKVLNAGDSAGRLTAEGAKLLDPAGTLGPGIPVCPPEGDAGTGMVATNSVAERTGNVSAGTSVFAMIVLEKALSRLYTEIDMVTTPTGRPVAMVHCNNCTSDLDAWVKIFSEANELVGNKVEKSALYDALYFKALEGDHDCSSLTSYNYYSGEPITGFETGYPLFVRTPDSRFNLANMMRTLLYSAMATLKIGMDTLSEKENVRLDCLLGHGGLFKTKGVGQQLMASALNVPVAVMESAGEGGAWGIALLAAYMGQNSGESLEDFLEQKVFSGNMGLRAEPEAKDREGFAKFMERYIKGLAVERAAAEHLL